MSETFTYNGHQFRIVLERDEDHGPPWIEHDGHGIVSDWTTRPKDPGEKILHTDRNSRRYYDVAATLKIAKRDQWGCPHHANPKQHATKGDQLACAVEADFEYLRRWCTDQWWYVGVSVVLLDAAGHNTRYRSRGIWGIESDAEDYHRAVAEEEADQLLADLPAQLDAEIARLQTLRATLEEAR